MQLIVVHQILIASAIALAGLFGLRSAVLFARGQGPLYLGLAVGSFVVAAALSVYLRKVRARFLATRGALPKRG